MKNLLKQSLIASIMGLFILTSQFLFSSSENTINNKPTEQQYLELFDQGESYRLEGNYKRAIESFHESLSLANKAGDNKKRIDNLLKLGLLYWNDGDLKKSQELYTEALQTARKVNYQKKEEEILDYLEIHRFYNEGKKYRSQNEYQKSIESFNKAINLARKSKSPEHEVKCLRQLSITHLDSNDLYTFYTLNKKALDIAKKINHRKEVGRCLNNIGLYYEELENYSSALRYHEDALQIAREIKNLNDQSTCLANISNIYNFIGNIEKALEFMEEALAIDYRLEDYTNISMDLNNIGIIYRRKGLISDNREDSYKALEYFGNCLKITNKNNDIKTEIQALNNIGSTYTDLENYPEALEYFSLGLKKAKEIQDLESLGMLLNNIGIVYYNQGNYELSTEYLQKSIDLALGLKGEKILWEAYFEIANAFRKQQNFQSALENYKNSISIIEDIRSKIKLEEHKATYLGTNKRIEAYHNLIDLLIQLHQSYPARRYNSEAFNYMERAKARAFLDSLEVSKVDISQGIDSRLLNQEKEFMKEITNIYQKLLTPELTEEEKNQLYEQLKSYEDKIEAVQREMRISSPAYANLKYPPIISLEEAQKNLVDNETAFFEYCLGKESSYAFVITKNELKTYKLPPASQIQKMVKDYLQVVTDKESKDFQLGYEIFASLVLPGLDKSINKLVFAPDDILHFLPFETLITQEHSQDWLIKDYTIAYIPSLSSLSEIVHHKELQRNRPKKDLLAFGDPDFGRYETSGKEGDPFQDYYSSNTFHFFRLKYSGQEIKGISSLFKERKRDAFKREEASEDHVKTSNLADYKILHFATHGIIDDKKPARSSIVLSLDQNSREDGFLQMREIFNLKLNCDLVTLSACQTGLGQFIRGEGIESLNRAFFYAGASSALISLWAVNDQASALLMERFYTHLRSSQSIMNALKKAKLEMISSQTLSHPYYWAGFIATGMADKVVFPSPLKKLALVLSLLFIAGGITAYKGFTRHS